MFAGVRGLLLHFMSSQQGVFIKEGERKGEREQRREKEGGREGEREGEKEGGREGGREGRREECKLKGRIFITPWPHSKVHVIVFG